MNDDTETTEREIKNKYGDPVSPNMDGSPGWWMCADCGTDYYLDHEGNGHCEYCYIVGTRYVVKVGNKVLYKGTDTEKAEAAYYGTNRAKWTRTEGVLINRPDDQPYES